MCVYKVLLNLKDLRIEEKNHDVYLERGLFKLYFVALKDCTVPKKSDVFF